MIGTDGNRANGVRDNVNERERQGESLGSLLHLRILSRTELAGSSRRKAERSGGAEEDLASASSLRPRMKRCCLNLERRVVGEHSEGRTEMGGQT
jgi:hypothetical protein